MTLGVANHDILEAYAVISRISPQQARLDTLTSSSKAHQESVQDV